MKRFVSPLAIRALLPACLLVLAFVQISAALDRLCRAAGMPGIGLSPGEPGWWMTALGAALLCLLVLYRHGPLKIIPGPLYICAERRHESDYGKAYTPDRGWRDRGLQGVRADPAFPQGWYDGALHTDGGWGTVYHPDDAGGAF
ncbi:MAG: hypothetical protein R3E02_13715 [Blastomonas sp.]